MLGGAVFLEHMEVSQLIQVDRQFANDGTTLQQSGNTQHNSNTAKTSATMLVTPLGSVLNLLSAPCSS